MRGTELVCAEPGCYLRGLRAPRQRRQQAFPLVTSKASWVAFCPDVAANSLSLFHLKSFPGRVSHRCRIQQAILLFTSKASRVAFRSDVAANKLFFFSLQKLPGSRLAPMSQPTSYSSFHLKSFPGCVSLRCRTRARNRAAIRRCYVPCGRGSRHPDT